MAAADASASGNAAFGDRIAYIQPISSRRTTASMTRMPGSLSLRQGT